LATCLRAMLESSHINSGIAIVESGSTVSNG
jgi:hypothetical protein